MLMPTVMGLNILLEIGIRAVVNMTKQGDRITAQTTNTNSAVRVQGDFLALVRYFSLIRKSALSAGLV